MKLLLLISLVPLHPKNLMRDYIQTMKKKTVCCAFVAWLLVGYSHGQTTQRSITVEELFQLVEQGSKALKVQTSEVGVAQRGLEEAKSHRLPDINVSLSASYNGNVLMTDRDFSNAKGISQPHFGNSFSLQAEQVVYAGGAINAGIRMAELQKEQSESGVEQTRCNQRFVALGQYLDLYKLANGIKVYDSNIALTHKLIADIKAKQVQGMALKNDVTRYELQLEQLKLGKRKLQDQKAILNHQLCNTLMLQGVEVVPEIELDKAEGRNISESQWQSDAISSSPMLRQSEIGMQMATQQLKLAKSELLPKVAIVAADNFDGPFVYDLPPVDKNFNIWYVGVGVKYSLSSLFKSNKTIRKAKQQQILTRNAHALANETLNNQVQQAYTLHQQAYIELETQQKSVQLAVQNYDVVNNRYLNQLALITDMVDASNIRLNAELQEVNARINVAYTYYNIMYAAGKL